MYFNTNDFLQAISQALDYIEKDLFGIATNHSKRIALIAVRIGQSMNMSQEELFDLISLALLHDNGGSLKILHDSLRGDAAQKQSILESMQEHCIIGEQNIVNFKFKTNQSNVIKYHHENHDGTGFFGISGDEIPLMSQIIHLCDKLDLEFRLNSASYDPEIKKLILEFMRKYNGILFSPDVTEIFIQLAEQSEIWYELSDDYIDHALKSYMPESISEYTYQEIREITKTFSKIIDAKSAFTQIHSSAFASKIEIMAGYYNYDEETTAKLMIAADLHDLGKLAIRNSILDKPGKLAKDEYDEIKKHPGVSKACLEGIKGFEQIVQWIYQHHEKLNGSGYPSGLTEDLLSFESRLLICTDIYQALTEDRPYRAAMDHIATMNVMQEMVSNNLLDGKIVQDINTNFRSA